MVATREADERARDLTIPAAAPNPASSRWSERIETWVGLAVVAACCYYIFRQLQPKLLFLDTTAAGGDTGAHVWFPAYLRDNLLGHFRLAGWSPDYYAGFPAGQFYFPLPALLTVILDVFLPYNVAFKLVTALGPILLPISAYVFGRGIRAPRPAPALMAVAVTCFLFFKDGGEATMKFDHHIMGGTLTSTLAGEFSFTIALACSLFFLGTLARALDKRGPMWLPAVLLAATLMSHLVVGVFALYAAIVIWLIRGPLRTATRAAAIMIVGGLLTAVWTLPLAATLKYTTDMRYEPVNLTVLASGGTTSYLDWLFISEHWYLFPLVIVAIVGGIVYRRRATLDVVAIGVAAGLAFYGWEGLRDVFGKAPAWNLRLLPFWFIMLYIGAALGAAEIVRLAARFVAWVAYGTEDLAMDPNGWSLRARRPVTISHPLHAPVADELVDEPADEPADFAPDHRAPVPSEPESSTTPPPPPSTAPLPSGLPLPSRAPDPGEQARSGLVRAVAMAILLVILASIALVRVDATRGYLPYWAKYNYTGYEGGTIADFTLKSYPEYREFMRTAESLPPGRMLWEGSDQIGAYGTPLALMLLPYWTHGRITTMEGLYYEASATTPYHFMAAATLMVTPSNAVRGLPYRTFPADFDLGVRYLQDLGVRYFAVTNPAVKEKADANPALTPIATVPDLDAKPPSGWTIYEVADSALVALLAYEPVVVDGMHEDPNWKCEGKPPPPAGIKADELSAWECTAVPWFNDPEALDRPLTADGPARWERAPQEDARSTPKEALPPVTVSDIHTTDDTIEFDVSRTGVPVIVKASYFPNWEVEGATGPYRATPNFMVVVPTSRHVSLTFGTTTVEWVGRVGTALGLVGVGLLVWWGWSSRVGKRDEPVADAGEDTGEDASDAGGPDEGTTSRRRSTVRFTVPFRARSSS